MLKKIKKYLNDKMILLPEGMELIRDFHDLEKWISSDSKMSIPGNTGNKTNTTNTTKNNTATNTNKTNTTTNTNDGNKKPTTNTTKNETKKDNKVSQ